MITGLTKAGGRLFATAGTASNNMIKTSDIHFFKMKTSLVFGTGVTGLILPAS